MATNAQIPKFISESKAKSPVAPSAAAAAPATAATPAAAASAPVAATKAPSPPPLNLCIVINICHYITPLAQLLIASEPLPAVSEIDREAFAALQSILRSLLTGKHEPINIFPFLDKICLFMNTSLNDFEEMDISFVWDNVVKLITIVIPPLRSLFLGARSLSLDEHAWISLISRCIHAQFAYPLQGLEDFIKLTLNQTNESNALDAASAAAAVPSHRHRSPLESIKNFNAIILSRVPDILAFAVESGHLPSSLRFLDALSKNPSKLKPPVCIKYPASFHIPCPASSEEVEYELVSVVSLEGAAFDTVQAFYRYVSGNQWYKGSGATHDLVDASRAMDNYLLANNTNKVHPRLLVYVRKGSMDALGAFVTRAGQLRSLGDAAMESAETPEQYDEARGFYEEAIAQDEHLKVVLADKLTKLEEIEKNQKASSYESQADTSLAKRRYKEACDLYKLANRNAVPGSQIALRIREKEDYMMKIISLEIANHLSEKGEECLKNGSYVQSKENFMQALKLNPSYVHLHSIIAGIDKVITSQSSAAKVAEAQAAMKVGRYKYANALYLEAIALVPEREAGLRNVLDSLVLLMQGEDALMKQRNGLVALEDKKYPQAISLITEAIALLPKESLTEHAFFLTDRAQVYYEMKDYAKSIEDCTTALGIKPELAIGYFRLGSAQFEQELFDEALSAYEKALRYDSSLGDQVKVKVRQVNTSKEIRERKLREEERAIRREEEKRLIEEKRIKDEKIRKERMDKQAAEQAEKAERLLMHKEEKSMLQWLNPVPPASSAAALAAAGPSSAAKQLSAEMKKKEKAEKEALRAMEKEKAKVMKEKEKERAKAEKEAKAAEEAEKKEAEAAKQREFAAEMNKAVSRLREAELLKEAERERIRNENERIIAERLSRSAPVGIGCGTPSAAGGPASGKQKNKKAGSGVPDKGSVPEKGPAAVTPLPVPVPAAVPVKGAKAARSVSAPTPAAVPVPPAAAAPKWTSLLSEEVPVPSMMPGMINSHAKEFVPSVPMGLQPKPQHHHQPVPQQQQVYEDFPPLHDHGPASGTVASANTGPALGINRASTFPASGTMPAAVAVAAVVSSSTTEEVSMPSLSPFSWEEVDHPLGSAANSGSKHHPLGSALSSSTSSLSSLHPLGGASSSWLSSSTPLSPSSSLPLSLQPPPSLGDLGLGLGLSLGAVGPAVTITGGGEVDGVGGGGGSSRLSYLFEGLGGGGTSLGVSLGESSSSLLGPSPFSFLSSDTSSAVGGGWEPSSGTSRLDKILGGLSSALDSSTSVTSPSVVLPRSFSSAFPDSGPSSFAWDNNNTSGSSLLGSAVPAHGGNTFSLTSLLSAAAPRRCDLNDLQKSIESEHLPATSFPLVAWMRRLGLMMFRWAMLDGEWVEFGLTIPRNIISMLGPGPGDAGVAQWVQDIASRSHCAMSYVPVPVPHILFVRGTVGSVANGAMDQALELVNNHLINLPAIQTLLAAPPAPASVHGNNNTTTSPLGVVLSAQSGLNPAQSAFTPSAVAPGTIPAQQQQQPSPAHTNNRWSSPPSAVYENNEESMLLEHAAALGLGQLPAAVTGTAVGAAVPAMPLLPAAFHGKLMDRPALLKLVPHPSGQVRRYVEIPTELIGLVIGAGGKKIKELGADSNCRIQFKSSKNPDGKPGILELQGTADTVDKGMALVWELVQSVGREYKEIYLRK